ncbi:alpha/beta fold hydrolase [Pseudonocardia humida]|uniref:Alpha/beta hydrolase n=1 Tax=Pseudonocardia humida TaxID=2800819 RepID=A0ABT1AAC6_9PSEU|nr:alpha/beta hydrolase [Pseudonocardia humida]MCO1660016.1 alpha/beta hydrolase [Pseudonocardia humida]
MSTSELSRVEIPDGHLAYRDTGAGVPVVLLHGGTLDHRMWDGQVGPLVAAGHRVIAVDARGHGASSTATAPFRHCDDVAVLLRALDTGPAVLVGVSMGASTVLDVALEHPELARALVISGAGTSEPDFRDPWILRMQADWRRAAEAADAEAWIETFLRLGAGPHRDVVAADPEVMARTRAMALDTITAHVPTGPDGRPTAPAPPTPVARTWERLPGVTAPLLAIIGGIDSDDHIAMAERAAGLVAHGRTATVGGTAHYPNMERPDLFDAILLRFLAEHAR